MDPDANEGDTCAEGLQAAIDRLSDLPQPVEVRPAEGGALGPGGLQIFYTPPTAPSERATGRAAPSDADAPPPTVAPTPPKPPAAEKVPVVTAIEYPGDTVWLEALHYDRLLYGQHMGFGPSPAGAGRGLWHYIPRDFVDEVHSKCGRVLLTHPRVVMEADGEMLQLYAPMGTIPLDCHRVECDRSPCVCGFGKCDRLENGIWVVKLPASPTGRAPVESIRYNLLEVRRVLPRAEVERLAGLHADTLQWDGSHRTIDYTLLAPPLRKLLHHIRATASLLPAMRVVELLCAFFCAFFPLQTAAGPQHTAEAWKRFYQIPQGAQGAPPHLVSHLFLLRQCSNHERTVALLILMRALAHPST